MFYLQTLVEAKAKFLLDEFFYRVETLPKWNPTILESHKVQVIDEHTDICYQIGAPGAGGLVTSRDFVLLRYWDFVEGRYIITVVSSEHPSLPKHNRYIRFVSIFTLF